MGRFKDQFEKSAGMSLDHWVEAMPPDPALRGYRRAVAIHGPGNVPDRIAERYAKLLVKSFDG